MISLYPNESRARDAWIVAKRLERNRVDPDRPYAFLVEKERAESGEVVDVATIFLTNRECPWKCLMCDLWKNTLTETVPAGAVPAQIDHALAALQQSKAVILPAPKGSSQRNLISASSTRGNSQARESRLEACPTLALRQIKLYNNGSFFDPMAIPVEDYPEIAARVRAFERVIIECHPALANERCLRFRDLLAGGAPSGPGSSFPVEAQTASRFPSPCPLPEERENASRSSEPLRCLEGLEHRSAPGHLEVAMGLETAHPEVLEKLNKRMTLELFSHAANFLRINGIAIRAFILVKPPFLEDSEALHWAERSLDFAFQCGVTVASLIPTRLGNGALQALAQQGHFSPPKLSTLEAALAYGIGLKKGRVFADLWDLERFADCPACFPARAERLRQMNLRQEILPVLKCQDCGAGAHSNSPSR
ncbi:MAG: hypothetical protein HY735_17530 [Verrucomicrobia bacterium]|nr:hypothetical protein [Verrucomicrobiota bacterium]